MNTTVPHPLSPTLDHITPLAEGGEHTPENVQLAHFICNSHKGDGSPRFGTEPEVESCSSFEPTRAAEWSADEL